MMALDSGTRDRQRFDHVRINRTLPQPFDVFQLLSLLIEHIDEPFSDNLTLLLRIGYARQFAVKLGFCIYADYIQAQMLVVFQYILELVLAQQTVVNEDTGQILADSPVEQHSRNR